MTTIQIRIDEKTKRKARAVFSKLGLDVTSGIKLYLARVVHEEALPFSLQTPLKPTPYLARILEAADKEWLAGSTEGPFTSPQDLLKSLHV